MRRIISFILSAVLSMPLILPQTGTASAECRSSKPENCGFQSGSSSNNSGYRSGDYSGAFNSRNRIWDRNDSGRNWDYGNNRRPRYRSIERDLDWDGMQQRRQWRENRRHDEWRRWRHERRSDNGSDGALPILAGFAGGVLIGTLLNNDRNRSVAIIENQEADCEWDTEMNVVTGANGKTDFVKGLFGLCNYADQTDPVKVMLTEDGRILELNPV